MKQAQITLQVKQEIQYSLKQYVRTFATQNHAAHSLEGCSEATIISILKGDEAWKSISEKMWLNVGKQVGAFKRKSKMVETSDFETMILYYSLAKEEGATFYITGAAGYGKTSSAKWYAEQNRAKGVYYLKCSTLWTKKVFLANILQAMGKDSNGMNLVDMMDAIVRGLSRQHQPLIIFDEMDKLTDPVLMFFIVLYNELDSLCGFVGQSTNQMMKRILRGLRSNKPGYQEFYSRIGSKFIELSGTIPEEVREICKTNGISKEEEIRAIINDYNGDLRKVDRHLLKHSAKKIREQLKSAA